MVGGVQKFVGKVGKAPPNSPGNTSGHLLCYREAHHTLAYSYKLGAFSVDADVWDEAHRMGAIAFVNYCKEIRTLYIIDQRVIEVSPIVDLGERMQYRVPVARCLKITNSSGIAMGHTNQVLVIPKNTSRPPLPGTFDPVEAPPPPKEKKAVPPSQLDLFS